MSSWPGLGVWIARRAALAPADVAIVYGDERLTYAAFDAGIRRAAGHLRSLGVAAGDRVAFHGRNEPAALVSLFAAASLGAVWVPIHPGRPAADVRFIVDDADARVVVQGRADAPSDALGGRIIIQAAELGADPAHDIDAGPAVSPSPDDLVVLGYTSGTSDTPKGVMLSHANLTWNVVHLMAAFAISPADVALAAAPLTRVGGLAVTVLEALFVGGAIVIPTDASGKGILQTIARERVTLLFANPDLLDAMASAPGWTQADLTSIRAGVVGGGLVPDALLQRYLDRGVRLRHGYGLTEAAPAVTMLDERDAVSHARSVGRPIGFVEVEVWNADGSRCAAGSIGEIVMRGPNVTAGYWHRPEATAAAQRPGGWFRTGDAGALDADGYLTLAGRVSDAIPLAEGLLYPAEIERLLYDAPGMADVAVVGVDGRPTLALVPRTGADVVVNLDHVHRALRPHLPAWKLPTSMRFVDAIPRNAAGKILRDRLRTELGTRN